ncbi:MAG TPA: enoyl-CoA hydratase-related protein [Stellaceae bacterium]|nr:enoyl-CoA hydratase-related protein [Stellaceae bacterium]
MGEFVRTEREGHLLVITLNRPEVLNALHAPACFELSEALDTLATDPELWVGIITGEGRHFCAGHDLLAKPEEEMPLTGWAGISERQNLDKPLIAALNGSAHGGGLEIALCADIIVAAAGAKLALSESRWGVVALGGGAQRLPLRLPRNVANAMMLAGRSLSVEDAERWGLVNEVVPADQVMAAARRWAADILANAPLAVGTTKRLSRETIENEAFTQRLAARRRATAVAVLQTEDAKEGIAAFREKRKPVWRGR